MCAVTAYYNEFDPFAAQWLRNLIAEGLIAHGDVDARSIRDVSADDLRGYRQCHFFAGIGGWSLAFRIAGLPDDFPAWTGSCPCQPYSSAGKQKGNADERDLWPVWFPLIRKRRPAVVFGEQVASAIRFGWLDRLSDDLEGEEYAIGAAVLRACSVAAPHERARLYFAAEALGDADGRRPPPRRETIATARQWDSVDAGSRRPLAYAASLGEREPDARLAPLARARARDSVSGLGNGNGEPLAYCNGARLEIGEVQPGNAPGEPGSRSAAAKRDGFSGDWRTCADGKRRLFAPGVPLLANGLPSEMARALAGFGNAIVPQVAAEFVSAWTECAP